MELDTLQYDPGEDGLALVQVDRPDKLNALNEQVLDELEEVFRHLREEDAVRGVILTGAGSRSFVAGADISQFRELDEVSGQGFAARGQDVFDQIEAMNKPVVAAVNGYALGGGCELALACHLRIASEEARFGQPEVGLGLIPGYGGTQRLPRVVGRGHAAELILTGAHIDAQRAYEIGLANRVVPADELTSAARELLATITKNAPRAIEMVLEALRASDRPLQEGLQYESTLFGRACATEDAQEGAAAFLEGRSPRFEGR